MYGIIVCVEYLASVSNWCFLIYGACHVHCVFCFILLLWGAAAREKKTCADESTEVPNPVLDMYKKPAGKLT